ncbi:MAG: carboxymuconolactone decarboxylase family protein [Verrucomicrobiota bacterium]|jgi:uncharacterized peroxidase-related enzyme
MWRLTPVESKESVQELQVIADRIHRPFSGVPNYLKLLAQSPAAIKAYVQAEAALGTGQLTRQQRECIALAVAAINGSDYCLAAHGMAGRKAGLTEAEISAAKNASARDHKTETLLYFVQDIVIQRGEVSDLDFNAMQKAGFSETEIIEVLANVALNIFTNYFNILARTALDNQFLKPEQKGRSADNLIPEHSS